MSKINDTPVNNSLLANARNTATVAFQSDVVRGIPVGDAAFIVGHDFMSDGSVVEIRADGTVIHYAAPEGRGRCALWGAARAAWRWFFRELSEEEKFEMQQW